MKLPLGWLMLTTFLLTLPGSAFPRETILSKIHFDKIAHVGVFAVLVWLFCRAYHQKKLPSKKLEKTFLAVTGSAVLYGVLMEFVQKNYIPNRSFDEGDLIADTAGALAGYLLSRWMFINKDKNITGPQS